ncbi:MAG: glycosyltransferase family 4 protein [Candidatus Omnitrophica bacterium]|nr:glycosyltransferase family 4 protein [Candidatus Omnitrophota bacterium]
MKIALITADFPPIEGGLSRLSTDLAHFLHANDSLSGVLAPELKGGDPFDQSVDYPISRVSGYNWGVSRIVPGFVRSFEFRRAILPHTDQILAINPSFGGLYGWMGSKMGGMPPYSLFAYGFEFLKCEDSAWKKGLLLKLYSNARKVFAISRFTREELIRFGVPTEKVYLCPLGVDTEVFRPEKIPGKSRLKLSPETEGPILLSVGRLIERKNHLQVLKCLKQLRGDFAGIEYWIVGRGPEEKKLKSFVRKEGLEKQVKFWGLIPDEDLPQFYQACDLFLLPAKQEGASVEGLGLVLQEAAACGKPTVGGRSGGIPDALIDGSTGLLVEPDNTEELCSKLSTLLSSPEKMERMGKAGLDWVRSERSWEVCVKRLVEMMEND